MAADPKKTTPLEKVRALEVGKLNAEHEPEGWVMVSVPERELRFRNSHPPLQTAQRKQEKKRQQAYIIDNTDAQT
jgi:hypothetical protein